MTDEGAELVVTVLRTGGFGGVRRCWRAEPPAADRSEWAVLIDQCPWDADATTPVPVSSGLPDRYVWSIHARAGEQQHSADVGEAALTGPWRELVERVREKGETVRPSAPESGAPSVPRSPSEPSAPSDREDEPDRIRRGGRGPASPSA